MATSMQPEQQDHDGRADRARNACGARAASTSGVPRYARIAPTRNGVITELSHRKREEHDEGGADAPQIVAQRQRAARGQRRRLRREQAGVGRSFPVKFRELERCLRATEGKQEPRIVVVRAPARRQKSPPITRCLRAAFPTTARFPASFAPDPHRRRHRHSHASRPAYEGTHVPRRGRGHRRRRRARRAHQAVRQAHDAPGGARGHRRLRRAGRNRQALQGPGAGRRDRRRGNEADARLRARPPRHRRHRPGRDERQRHPRAGRRAAVLPRLLRDRQARRRRRRIGDQGRRRRLRTGGLRADRRRDGRNARHVRAGRIRSRRLCRRRRRARPHHRRPLHRRRRCGARPRSRAARTPTAFR